MSLFRRKVPAHLIRVHPDNVKSRDWLILLEAGTIVGPSPERLRCAFRRSRPWIPREAGRRYRLKLAKDSDDPGRLPRRALATTSSSSSGQLAARRQLLTLGGGFAQALAFESEPVGVMHEAIVGNGLDRR